MSEGGGAWFDSSNPLGSVLDACAVVHLDSCVASGSGALAVCSSALCLLHLPSHPSLVVVSVAPHNLLGEKFKSFECEKSFFRCDIF